MPPEGDRCRPPPPRLDRHDADLAARCGPIELLLVDVDGVLTDGVIAVDDRGVETKHFHVRDGSAIALWRKAGKRAAILSGRWAPLVDRRAAELGIAPVIQGAADKRAAVPRLIADLGLEPGRSATMGDDLADLPVLGGRRPGRLPGRRRGRGRRGGPRRHDAPGGRGAVREVVEVILKHQGAWDGLVDGYRAEA